MIEGDVKPCPQCGAALPSWRGQAEYRCEYCGAPIHVSRPQRQSDAPRGQPTAPSPGTGRVSYRVGMAIVLGTLVVALVMIVAVFRQEAVSGGKKTARDVFWFLDPPMLTDADGDGIEDVVAGFGRFDSRGGRRVGAFSGVDGHRLWESRSYPSEAFGSNALRALTAGGIAIAVPDGTVELLDVRTGAKRWAAQLGANPWKACANEYALAVQTRDEVLHAFTLDKGASFPVAGFERSACAPVYNSYSLGTPYFHFADSDNHDSLAVEGLVRDAIKMSISKVLVPDVGDTRVLLGSGKGYAGSYLIAVLDGINLVWQAYVSSGNPAHAHAPSDCTSGIRHGRLVVTYDVDEPKQTRMACFDVADGKRRWDVALANPEAGRGHLAISKDGQIFIAERAGRLTGYSLQDGKVRFAIGDPSP